MGQKHKQRAWWDCIFFRKDKNPTRSKYQRAVCVGIDKSSAVLMHQSKLMVIGCFWRDFVPMMRWVLSWLGPRGSCSIHRMQNLAVNGEGQWSWGYSSHIGTKRSCATGMRESMRWSKLRREEVWGWNDGRTEGRTQVPEGTRSIGLGLDILDILNTKKWKINESN